MKPVLTLILAATLTQAQQYDLLLKNGRLIDPKNGINAVTDVAIANGKIAQIATAIPAIEAKRTVDLRGLYVTPGLIDIHVHVFPRPGLPGVERDSSVNADAFSFRSGVTTVVDAGTTGLETFPAFKAQVIDRAQTRVLAMLNIVAAGMGTGKEDDPAQLDVDGAVRMANENKGVIVGFKSAHYAGPGWESIDAATAAGKKTDLPVMVDFGYLNNVRSLPTLLEDKLRAGDIYTHCFSGHRQELLDNGKINPAMTNGRKRGIFFDIGHGAGSFYWYVAMPAYAQGFRPDSISTDLHTGSMNAGMKDMANVMSKMLNLGSPIAEVVAMSTWNPAREIKRPDLGHLSIGAEADLAVLAVENGRFGYMDSAGAANVGDKRITAEMTIRAGKVVWDLNARAATHWQRFLRAQEVDPVRAAAGAAVIGTLPRVN
ncbi:MAG: amidohydrolase/deacetylase family metallohydrolase [Bryobacteraceae bacterium]